MGKDKIITGEDIKKIANGFRESRILLTAFELGLFSILGKKELSSEEVADEIKADARAVDRLMNALVGMKLLYKKAGNFSNTEASLLYLEKDSPHYMGSLMHTVHLWDTWNTLTPSVIKGRSVFDREMNKRSDEWLEAFIAAMHYRAGVQAKEVSGIIDLNDVALMLDLGGGSAAFSMGFIDANPSIKAVVFDLPGVIPITKKYVAENGMEDKFKFIQGNYLHDDIGNNYDLIFLSAIIHINSFEENSRLIEKCAHALNVKGQIIVQDFVMNEERTMPAHGAVFALNMLVGTEKGDTYTETEISGWMEKAGLTRIKREDTSFGTSLIIGKKS